MSLPRAISPTSLIEREILEKKHINFSIKNDEEFIAIAHKKNLKINWAGFWIWENVK